MHLTKLNKKEVDVTERFLVNHHVDSRRRRHLTIRNDDVLVGTYAKSGLTQMQYMVQKLLDILDDTLLKEKIPWFEFPFPPIDELVASLEAQQHRRSIKYHIFHHRLSRWTCRIVVVL